MTRFDQVWPQLMNTAMAAECISYREMSVYR